MSVKHFVLANGSTVKYDLASLAGARVTQENITGFFESGAWSGDSMTSNTKRARSKIIPPTITYASCEAGYSFATGLWDNGTFTGYLKTDKTVSPGTTNILWTPYLDIGGLRGTYTASDIRIMVKSSDNADLDPRDIDSVVTFEVVDVYDSKVVDAVVKDEFPKAIEVEYQTRTGYIASNGIYVSAGDSTKEVYTNKIPVFEGDNIMVSFDWYTNSQQKWACLGTYDSDGKFISREAFVDFVNDMSTTRTYIVPAGVSYVAITWRNYDGCDVRIFYKGSLFNARNRVARGLRYSGIDGGLDTCHTSPDSESVLKLGYGVLTDFVEVHDGEILVIKKVADYTGTIFRGCWWFDDSKEYLQETGRGNIATMSTTVTPPVGARYARVWFGGNNGSSDPGYAPDPETVRRCIDIHVETDMEVPTYVWAFGENVKGINHRGYTTAPENTLPAYKLSKQVGFKYVECDVSMTSDRVPVLLHDDTINRTARNPDGTEISQTINIGDITYEQALQYDFGIWKSPAYAGTKIPTFEEFITLCRNLGLHPYIELKSGGGYTQAEIQGLIDIVSQNGMAGKVTWISFAAWLLEYVKNCDASARLGYITQTLQASYIPTAVNLKTGTNEVFLDVSALPDELVDDCITAGLPVEVWTVDTVAWLLSLNDYVSGVTSDELIAAKVLYEANI